MTFYPYSDNMKDTVISGPQFEVDRFLRYYMKPGCTCRVVRPTRQRLNRCVRRKLRYIAPDMDFSGYIQVLFKVVSGMVMNHGAELCESNVVVRVVAVYNDPAAVLLRDSIRSGYQCQVALPSCALYGISLYDSVPPLHYLLGYSMLYGSS